MKHLHAAKGLCCCRREFLQTVGAGAGTVLFLSGRSVVAAAAEETPPRKKAAAIVRGAFVYAPSASLEKIGYWSWPGSSFDPEGHQKRYMAGIKQMEQKLGIRISMDEKPLDVAADTARFINEVKQSKPDGLLLIPFKKYHWPHVTRIIEETKLPTVVLATLGVLLVGHINQLHRKGGVYLISSMDNLDAVESGMRMIKTARWMKEGRIVNIQGSKVKEGTVPHLGTRVRTVPVGRFVDEFKRMETTNAVKKLAQAYRKNAKEVIEPTEGDIADAAKTYFVLRKILETEKADAIMMQCLGGLKKPHKHPPPCMGFMSLRDEGVAVGCQSDLNATLTLMLVQQLFDRPGFQQNASMETEKNHYFGAHCTSASKMNGVKGPSEPYILRSHAEAGWGCVPQVLFRAGQEVTMAQYLSGKAPRMLIYTGKVVKCYPKAKGGCRSNIEMTINEVKDVCDVKGMHQIVFYGDYGRQLRAFCQLYGINAVS